MAEQSLEQLEQEFHQIVSGIHPADVVTKGNAQKKWNSIAKPLHSLGKLEDHIMQIAALTGDTDVNLNRKALIVMCADNGVVEEGVTQTGQEVTAVVAENFTKSETSVCKMAQIAPNWLPLSSCCQPYTSSCIAVRFPVPHKHPQPGNLYQSPQLPVPKFCR